MSVSLLDKWTALTDAQQVAWWRRADDAKKRELAKALRDEMRLREQEAERMRRAEAYWADPSLWAYDRFGIRLWSKQEEMIAACVPGAKVAVKSCHEVGKSFGSALAAARWIDLHPAGDAYLVTTAPTGTQVKVIMWRYLRSLWARGGLPGVCNTTSLSMLVNGAPQIVGMGRKPADTDEDGFQGVHAKYVFLIVDEANGVASPIWEAGRSLVANGLGCILAVGNPDNPVSTFARTFGADPTNGYKQMVGWRTMSISAFDTPNFTGEEVPVELAQSLINHRYVEELRADLGENDPIYRSKVLGEFSVDATDSVIPASKVAICRRPVEDEDVPAPLGVPRLGVDVGAGVDRFVIQSWYPKRSRAGKQWAIMTRDSEEAADLVVQAINEIGASDVNIDAIGVGWGVVGSLNRRKLLGQHSAHIHPVTVSNKSSKPHRYRNLRAELWWEFSRLVVDEIAELDEIDDMTASDLAAIRGGPDAHGYMTIEPKDETKKRIGRSPDAGDALMLAAKAPDRVAGRARVLRAKRP